MRKDGVRITHDPYAKGVAEKYGKPEETDPEGFDPSQDSVGAGIYGGRVKRDDKGKIIYGKQYQNHNPKPGPVYAGHGYADLVDALKHGEDAVLRELDNGSDVNEVLTGGATPLHMCGMSQKNQLMTKLLIDRGADIEALDTYGYTPLHRMASNNLVIGAKALLDAGADPENVGEAGETPLQVAMSSFAVDVVQVLRNHMSKRQKVSLEEFEIRKCGVTDLIGKYKRLESDGNIPRGFAKVCR